MIYGKKNYGLVLCFVFVFISADCWLILEWNTVKAEPISVKTNLRICNVIYLYDDVDLFRIKFSQCTMVAHRECYAFQFHKHVKVPSLLKIKRIVNSHSMKCHPRYITKILCK